MSTAVPRRKLQAAPGGGALRREDRGEAGDDCDTCLERADRPIILQSLCILQEHEMQPAAVALREFVASNSDRIRSVVEDAARRRVAIVRCFVKRCRYPSSCRRLIGTAVSSWVQNQASTRLRVRPRRPRRRAGESIGP